MIKRQLIMAPKTRENDSPQHAEMQIGQHQMIQRGQTGMNRVQTGDLVAERVASILQPLDPPRMFAMTHEQTASL
jgi:hypothetical protein